MEENRMGRMGDLIKESTIRNYLAGASYMSGMICFYRGSTYDKLFGKGLGGLAVYVGIVLIIVCLIWGSRKIRVPVREGVQVLVEIILYVAIVFISIKLDKLVPGNSDAWSITSYGFFALMSVIYSRKSELGFETVIFTFFLSWFSEQLFKINWKLLPIVPVFYLAALLLRPGPKSSGKNTITPVTDNNDIERQNSEVLIIEFCSNILKQLNLLLLDLTCILCLRILFFCSPEIPQAQGWDKIQGKAYQLPAIWKITQRSLMKLRTISQVIMEEFQRKAEQKLFGTINKITFKRIQGRRAMRVVPPNPYPPNPSLPDHRKRIRGTTAVEIASGLHCYLKCWCGAHVSWDKTGSIQTASIPKPGSLPPLKDEGLMIKRPVAWNYYQNVVTSS